MGGVQGNDVMAWSIFGTIVPALLPTITIIIVGVLILRRLPRK